MGLNELPDFMSYQLVHRLASALMEARKCFAPYAMMIVHSFNKEKEHFTDYQAFLRLWRKGPENQATVQVIPLHYLRVSL